MAGVSEETNVTKDEVSEWMRAHPGMALQLAIETDVIRKMSSTMWCDKHGGHPVEADHLYEYGPETCHVHPLLWATGLRPICLQCGHTAIFPDHSSDGCHWAGCDCLSSATDEDDLPFDLNHGFDYREWVDPSHAHTPPPPWVGL